MANPKDVLLLGAAAPTMELLGARLSRLGYRAIAAKTPEQAHMLLRISRGAIGAVVIPPEFPVVDLKRTLIFLSSIVKGELWFLAAGPTPPDEERRELRAAGVAFQLFEPIHDHTLRFQINRALAGSGVVRGHRTSLRAPTNWTVPTWANGRMKEAHVYSVSASGAFLSTPTASVRGTRITLQLPLEGSTQKLTARVVATNVPGNLAQKALPTGMGVAFENAPSDAEVQLHMFAQERLDALSL